MNWKLLIQLSVFGLIMAGATVSLIPEKIEPVFWLVIFIFCGVVCARQATGKYFLHGFVLSLLNAVWIVVVHCIFITSYSLNHPDTANMKNIPPSMAIHPRLLMLIFGPIFGAVFGVIQGLFFFIISKIVKPAVPKEA
jgi:hypothetical protein